MKKIILILIILSGINLAATAQTEIKIKTSAECEKCKKKLESNLVYEKGVKFVKVDLTAKVLTVNYNAKKTTPREIKLAVSKLGYEADELKPDSIAYLKLPECCRIPGMHHDN